MTDAGLPTRAPHTSVIFIGFNGARWIADAVASALDQETAADDYAVIYVDNASTDGSADLIERRFPGVQVVRLQRNLGFYGAFNRVAVSAPGEFIVAVPQDVILHRKWLSELVRVAQADARVLVAVTNTLGPGSTDYDPKRRDGAVSECTWVSLTRLGYVRLRRGPWSREPRQTLACAGCSALLRRDLLRLSGRLFDEGVGHYAGDVEVGVRASVLGGRVMQVPTAIVYHVGEEEKSHLDVRLLLRYAAGSRDQVVMYYQNMTTPEFLLFLPVLWLGLAAKAGELRVRVPIQAALFCLALVASPFVMLSAFARLPAVRAQRDELLHRRRVAPSWLLRRILSGSGPSVRTPIGLVWSYGRRE